MPAEVIDKNMVASTSFLGLQSYTEEQANLFFGRDKEINLLTTLIRTNTLTIVFGKSGTGKTSLLNAGVFPKLRVDNSLPFKIRLDFRDDSPDLITQIKQVLRSEIDRNGIKVENYPSTETLWEYFHREPIWKRVSPILVFDQFEEMFTLAKKSTRFGDDEIENFWEELSDLVENSIPKKLVDEFLHHPENIDYDYKTQNIKMLFSFREEFLPEFESIKSKIPSIKYSRFRLMPMNGNQAYEVITKTWKDKIDDTEANKIVGFLTNVDDTNLNYDVMEIEPSLISQVCAYIDKERINAGTEKISAEFLNKYPKEIILRSIYNEVLAESNAAVNKSKSEQDKIANPINEFIEDKLITDEGYRIQYSLNAQDEKVRPGINVLEAKYFVRDDGKSVELTHDVLVPLIKTDREKRRKDIAVEAARKKARRRAFIIIIGALLISGLVGAAIYFPAKNARDNAYKEAKDASDSTKILRDSSRILTDSINKKSKKLADLITALNNQNAKGNHQRVDSPGNLLGNINDSNAVHDLQNQLTDLKKQYDDLKSAKTALDNINSKLDARVNSLTGDQSRTESENNELKRNIGALSKLKHDDSIEFKKDMQKLKGEYDLLKRNFEEYKLRYPVPPVVPPVNRPLDFHPDPTPDGPDPNGLQLNLYYSSPKNKKVPGNLKIYLIPDSSYNKKIIREAMLYEIRCDELHLDNAQGKTQIATFNNKIYSFHNVAPGKYFIKICAYYGGYYLITKKTIGNVTTRPLDLSPPIR